jgi:hypothetical protein
MATSLPSSRISAQSVALPTTVMFCIVGFFIGGGSRLMVGMVLGGVAGWIVLAKA